MLTEKAAIAANRFGLGARPGDAEEIGADHVGWLEDQLDRAAKSDAKPQRPPASAGVLQEVRDLQLSRALAQRARAQQGAPNGAPTDRRPEPQINTEAIRDFGQLIRDCLDRGEQAMTQAHAFKAAELCLRAQVLADVGSVRRH